MKRLITVFCDASFDPNTKEGSFAVWAKCDGIAKRWSGAFKTTVPTSSDAEYAAVANALHLVNKHYLLDKTDVVVLQSDCIDAMQAIRRGQLAQSQTPIKVEMLRRAKELSCRIIARHVKGHRPNTAGPRHAVNNWTDKAAKAARRK